MVTQTIRARSESVEALKTRCRALGVTHSKIAEECNVSRPAVSMVLSDRTVLRRIVETARRLADEAERAPRR